MHTPFYESVGFSFFVSVVLYILPLLLRAYITIIFIYALLLIIDGCLVCLKYILLPYIVLDSTSFF